MHSVSKFAQAGHGPRHMLLIMCAYLGELLMASLANAVANNGSSLHKARLPYAAATNHLVACQLDVQPKCNHSSVVTHSNNSIHFPSSGNRMFQNNNHFCRWCLCISQVAR